MLIRRRWSHHELVRNIACRDEIQEYQIQATRDKSKLRGDKNSYFTKIISSIMVLCSF